ncbi:unnamed protein product, partial [Ectocarpus sp. 12 AP-2014]
VRGLNRSAYAFLVGTKYDLYTSMPAEEQRDIDKQARKFAKAMHAPLIFTSASHSINVQKARIGMFKVVLSRVFDLRCNLDEISGAGEPLLLFSKEEGEAAASKAKKASSSSSSSSPTEGAADARKGAAK